MAKKNYREIQLEYRRRSAFSSTSAGKRWGDLKPEPVPDILERLSMPIAGGCWKWLGQHDRKGYAKIMYRTRPGKRLTRKTATVAWELANAMEVPIGLEISHTCSNEWCVNPDHLVAETHSENIRRRKPWRVVLNCKHCGQPKVWVKNANAPYGREWACPPCRTERAAQWRKKTNYSYSEYRERNKDRINAQRRARRNRARLEGRKVT